MANSAVPISGVSELIQEAEYLCARAGCIQIVVWKLSPTVEALDKVYGFGKQRSNILRALMIVSINKGAISEDAQRRSIQSMRDMATAYRGLAIVQGGSNFFERINHIALRAMMAVFAISGKAPAHTSFFGDAGRAATWLVEVLQREKLANIPLDLARISEELIAYVKKES